MTVYPDDATQQLVHMSGLVYASCFKLKHVAAPGQDPLARGWTRGGEIYLWVPKGVKAECDLAWPPVTTVRGELGHGTGPSTRGVGGVGGGGVGGGGVGGGGVGSGGVGGGGAGGGSVGGGDGGEGDTKVKPEPAVYDVYRSVVGTKNC